MLLEIWQKVKGWPKQPHIRKNKVRFSGVNINFTHLSQKIKKKDTQFVNKKKMSTKEWNIFGYARIVVSVTKSELNLSKKNKFIHI